MTATSRGGSPRGGATISQVAAAAGVSQATVSRVMNRRTTVAPEIAARVRAAAEELRYRPSTTARSLSLGRTGTVALVVPDLSNPVFQQVLRGVVAVADTADLRVLVAETAERPEAEAEIAREARNRCDAVVLAAPRMPAEELRALLPEVDPVVLIDRVPSTDAVPAVSIDYGHGIHLLVEHLVSLGHRHLVHVAGAPAAASSPARARALAEAQARHPGLRITTVLAGSSVAAGYGVADEVLDTRATAALTFNDLVAFGLVARFNEIGVAVPDDLSVTGFDDIELARFATPSLTTAGVDHAALGRRAAARLLAVVEGRRDGPAARDALPGSGPGDGDVLVPRLEVRASTGPVPPARGLSPAPGPAVATGPGTDPRPRWVVDGTGARLNGLGLVLAHHVDGTALPRVHSPRPYLHPVRTLAGVPVTVAGPVVHRHQYGVSLALPDVDGTNHWGGRTHVPGRGPTLLLDHGRQEVSALHVSEDGATLAAGVRWLDRDEGVQFSEERELTAALLPEQDAWVLSWRSRLHAPRRTTITSPASRGRPGAGFGGVFWRLASAEETHVLTPETDDERRARGSRTPWLALVRRTGRSWTSLLLVQDPAQPPRPWFLRVADYVGAGPALAWEVPLTVEAGEELRVDLHAVVVDRRLDADGAEGFARTVLGARG
ncbi:DUF6807 family protein [Kineococcus sp. SYSU DK001]|uniref:DUF6807 family protein n=1 Tax=Kineococcus sp. SYSU DK001 TaxID=3383122 RepID=UPI003D7D3649